MIKRSFFYVFIIVFVFALAKAHSQDFSPEHQISLRHDNDFLLGIDRYYTTGSFIGYSRGLSSDFIFKHSKESPLQLDLLIGQETYTPRELFSTDFDDLERPYAGYLFVSGSISQAKQDHIWLIKGEVGLAGPISFAGSVQRAYHELINEFIPSWVGEIENSFHINGYGSYIKSFQKEHKFFIDLHSSAALGTRQIFAEQQAVLFFGKRDRIGRSSFYNRIGQANEFYAHAGAYYRYVGLNALVQGHPWGDRSPFTLPIENQLIGVKAGVTVRRSAHTFQFEFVTQTNETQREGQLQYTSIIYKRNF